MAGSIDRLDAELLALLGEDPRTGVMDLAERLGVTRNTVQARLTRLTDSGVVTGHLPQVDLAAIGLAVSALLNVELSQGVLDDVTAELAELPHVLEVHATTGGADLVVRLAAADNAQLLTLVQSIHAIPGVLRTTTVVLLTTPVPLRVQPLLDHVTGSSGRGRAGR